MSWSTIAAAEVLEEFTPQEKASINAIQGATSNLAAVLGRVANAWRGSISAGGNAVGPVNTIPDQVREDVIAEARWRWLTSLPLLKKFQTDERRDLYNDANDRREKIEAGKVKVEPPETVLEVASPVNAVSTPRPGRRLNTCGFDKLSST